MPPKRPLGRGALPGAPSNSLPSPQNRLHDRETLQNIVLGSRGRLLSAKRESSRRYSVDTVAGLALTSLLPDFIRRTSMTRF